MSLSAKREALARLHGRYSRAGRPHKTRILDEFCATCGYHRKAALRLLNRPLPTAPPKRPGPKIIYDPIQVQPVLKTVWLASDQLCSKLLKAALPEWLEHHQRRSAPLPEAFKEKLLGISPAQIDRLLRSARVQHPKKGLAATHTASRRVGGGISRSRFGAMGRSWLLSVSATRKRRLLWLRRPCSRVSRATR